MTTIPKSELHDGMRVICTVDKKLWWWTHHVTQEDLDSKRCSENYKVGDRISWIPEYIPKDAKGTIREYENYTVYTNPRTNPISKQFEYDKRTRHIVMKGDPIPQGDFVCKIGDDNYHSLCIVWDEYPYPEQEAKLGFVCGIFDLPEEVALLEE